MMQVVIDIMDDAWGYDDIAEELRDVADLVEDGWCGGTTSFGNNWGIANMHH